MLYMQTLEDLGEFRYSVCVCVYIRVFIFLFSIELQNYMISERIFYFCCAYSFM